MLKKRKSLIGILLIVVSITSDGEITAESPLAMQDYLNGKLVYQRENK